MLKFFKLLFLASFLAFSGCTTYVSNVPLSTAKNDIDEDLLGTWSSVSTAENAIVTMKKKTNSTYRIIIEGLSKESGEWEKQECTGFITTVENIPIINVEYREEDGDIRYIFLKYNTESTNQMILFKEIHGVKVWDMQEDLFEYKADDGTTKTIDFKTSSDLYKYVMLNIKKEDLFRKEPSILKRLHD